MVITAFIVVSALVYEFKIRKSESEISSSDKRSDSEVLLKTNPSFEALKREFAAIPISRTDAFPVRAANFEKRIEVTKQALTIAETDMEKQWSKLNFMSMAVALENGMVRNGLSESKSFDELRKYAAEWENDADTQVKEAATLSTLIVKMFGFLRSEGAEVTIDDVKLKLEALLKRHPDSVKIARSLKDLFTALRLNNKFQPVEVELRMRLWQHYSQRSAPELKMISDGFFTDALLVKYDIPAKQGAFVVNRPSAARELAAALADLASNETPNDFALVRLVGSCNVLELFGHYELAVQSIQKLTEAANRLPESETTSFREVANRTITRCRAIGAKLRVKEKAADGSEINSDEFPRIPLLIFYLRGKDRQLKRNFQHAKELEQTYGSKIKIIMIAVGKDAEDTLQLAAEFNRESDLIIDTDRSTQLFRQFPVDSPSAVLIADHDHIMKRKVINFRDLRSALIDALRDNDEEDE